MSITVILSYQLVKFSLILSKLDYCNSMYVGTHANNLRKLQSVQNSAARLIFGSQTNHSYQVLFSKLHWLPIKNRIIFKICMQVHKCLYHIAPEDLMLILHPSDSFIRTAKLRFTYTPQRCHGFKAFSVCAPKAWNALPYTLRCEINLSTFKTLLKTELFRDSFSTLYYSILHP